MLSRKPRLILYGSMLVTLSLLAFGNSQAEYRTMTSDECQDIFGGQLEGNTACHRCWTDNDCLQTESACSGTGQALCAQQQEVIHDGESDKSCSLYDYHYDCHYPLAYHTCLTVYECYWDPTSQTCVPDLASADEHTVPDECSTHLVR
jgi:hypothetical protein